MVTEKKTTTPHVKAEKPKAPRKVAVSAKGGSASGGKKAVKADETAAVEVKEKAHVVHADATKYHKALGRRKEATARVRLIPGGKGNIIVNGKEFDKYFTVEWHRQSILAPLVAVGENDSYDVSAKIEGGGVAGQAIALQHGVARCLLLVNPDYRKTLRRAGYLTRDPRAKERKKPGLKRARKRGQWAKR
jgi:small subunit ribosomal protein S9